MITANIPQGSAEWFSYRTGIPTASNFNKIITTKGEKSKQWDKYLYQLAGERITGVKEESYTNAAMQRGIELEADARELWQLLNDMEAQQVGICYQDEQRLFSCSPDGLVGSTGGLEIKCPSMAMHVGYLLAGRLPTDYFQQVQGSLFVTGLKFWEFMSYYPGIQPLILTVKPDSAFHASLSAALVEFCRQLDEVTARIR